LNVDLILIENQPVKLNAVMKSIQMILWTTIRTLLIQQNNTTTKLTFMNADKKLLVIPNDDPLNVSNELYTISAPQHRNGKTNKNKGNNDNGNGNGNENDVNSIISSVVSSRHASPMIQPSNPPENIADIVLNVSKQNKRIFYNKRKMDAVSRVKILIQNNKEKLSWFEKNSKKDDLADTLLMCLYAAHPSIKM